MTNQVRKRAYQRSVADCPNYGFDLFSCHPEFPDDILLTIAFTISECIITFVGPIFWVCLVSLFFAAELGLKSLAI